jgi:tRNA/rRNA methyltransferase
MKNMGLRDLVVVAPNAALDFAEAHTRAVHAADVLENRRQFDTLAEAIGDCAIAAATTARPGLYRKHAKSPREWAPRLLESAAAGNKVALVFGTEDDGLSNDEMSLCTQLIRIPSTHTYASLNLAHAVMICCYELYVASGEFKAPQEGHPEAGIVLRERMLEMWREMLRDTGFFDQGKEEHMMMAFRRIFARSPLTEADINILMGVARQARWAALRGHKPQGK